MIRKEQKELIKLKLGLCLKQLVDENKNKSKENKLEGIKDHKLVSSLRKLEAATELRFATLQQIASGEVNATFTSIVIIADALNITLSQFFANYDAISDQNALDYKTELKKAKEERKKKKKE